MVVDIAAEEGLSFVINVEAVVTWLELVQLPHDLLVVNALRTCLEILTDAAGRRDIGRKIARIF